MRVKVILYAVAAAVSLALYFYMRSDAVRIRRTLDEVADLVSKEPNENFMGGMSRARGITTYLAEPFRCRLFGQEAWTTVSRENAASAIAWFRNGRNTISVEFEDLKISSDDGIAHVTGVVLLDGSPSTDEFPLPRKEPFEAEMKDVDGRWIFTMVKASE